MAWLPKAEAVMPCRTATAVSWMLTSIACQLRLAMVSVNKLPLTLPTTVSDATLARMKHGKYVGVRGEPRRDGVCVLRKLTLYRGLQWPWPSSASGMLSTSTDIARARRWSNHLAPLVSSGGAKQLAFLFALSPLAVGMPTQILMTRRTETHVERAPIMSFHS